MSLNEIHILKQNRKQCWACRLYEEDIKPRWGGKEVVAIIHVIVYIAIEGWIKAKYIGIERRELI